MRVLENLQETTFLCQRYRAAGLSIGFVPTLGALHAGHASLIRQSALECEKTVVSIFVNPTQFGPGEDFAAYPRQMEADTEICRGAGADLVFFASSGEVYPEGFQTWVTVEDLTRSLCGGSRPGHFRGVATVVTQLLSIVQPHRAYFGQKDYQQCQVVRRLTRDLHLGLEIRVAPTIREPDGLALSSRNRYLDVSARRVAPRIYQALQAGSGLILGGEPSVERVIGRMIEELSPGEDLRLDYVEVRDSETLRELEEGRIGPGPGSVLLAVAAVVGKSRLIDNVLVPLL